MATSGSTNFNPNRDELIKSSLRLIGVTGIQETPSAEMIVNASQALNLIAKHWMTDGMHAWLQDEATLFLEKDKQEYTLGPSGDHCSTTHVKTEVRVAASSGTTLEVDSTTSMTAADNIGLELDDGTMHWTTIASITDSDTLELTDAIPSATAVDNHVYTYTSLITRPYKITEMWHHDSGDEDTPIRLISRQEYTNLSAKDSTGQTTQYFYDRQLDDGLLHVWPTSDNLKDRIQFYFHREVQDFDTSSDTPDFPKHFLRPLKYQLAADLGPEYGVDPRLIDRLEIKAAALKEQALMFDDEPGSIYFGVDNVG